MTCGGVVLGVVPSVAFASSSSDTNLRFLPSSSIQIPSRDGTGVGCSSAMTGYFIRRMRDGERRSF